MHMIIQATTYKLKYTQIKVVATSATVIYLV